MPISLLHLSCGRSPPLLTPIGLLPNALVLQTSLFITEVGKGLSFLIIKQESELL